MTHEQQIEKLKASLVAAQLREAARNAGVASHIVDDLMLHSQSFTVASDCQTVTHRESGLAPADWLKGMEKDRPHWFTQPGKAAPESFDRNPWTAEHWNITNQGKIMESSMPQAEAMARAAGVDVMAAHPKKA